jgi:hypothetical protein
VAIQGAEKLNLTDSPYYHSLLGDIYNQKALRYFETALMPIQSLDTQATIRRNINKLKNSGSDRGGGATACNTFLEND